MNLSWPSPWEEDAIISPTTPLSPLRAAVLAPSRDHHAVSWGIVERGGFDWAPTLPNEWTSHHANLERERSLSETSVWGTLDDSYRGLENKQTPFHSRLSVPVPVRQSSPDPWAATVNNGRSRADSKEKSYVYDQDLSVPDFVAGFTTSNGVRRVSDLHIKATVPSSLELPHEQSVSTVGDDSISSCPSSSLSHHGDNLTESTRTSFDQDDAKVSTNLDILGSNLDRLDTKIAKTSTETSTTISNKKHTIERSNISEGEIENPGHFEAKNISDGTRSNVLRNPDLHFNVDQHLLDKFLSDVCGIFTEPDHKATNEDIFTTIEEQRLWHRISRYGTMRKYDSGSDDDYRRVTWCKSKLRQETLHVVSRWRREDTFNGGVAHDNTGSLFGWNEKEKRNSSSVKMSEIWAKRPSKHQSIPDSLQSPSTSSLGMVIGLPMDVISPREPTANVAWNTEDTNFLGETEKSSTPITAPPPFLLKIEPKPPSFASLLSHSLQAQDIPVDSIRNPQIGTMRFGHSSNISSDGKPCDPLHSLEPQEFSESKALQLFSVPSLQEWQHCELSEATSQTDNDYEDWGDMVTPEFDPPDEARSESQMSRDRTKSAPHPTPFDNLSPSELSEPTQLKAQPFSFPTDFATLEELVPSLDGQMVIEPEIPILSPIPQSRIKLSASHIRDDIPNKPSLLPTAENQEIATPEKVDSAHGSSPMPLRSASEIHIGDVHSWDTFDAMISHTTSATTSDLPPSPFQPPTQAPSTDAPDPWANADLSFFEQPPATPSLPENQHPTPASFVSPSPPAAASPPPATHHPSSTAPTPPSASSPSAEETRLIQHILSHLPDLKYMFSP